MELRHSCRGAGAGCAQDSADEGQIAHQLAALTQVPLPRLAELLAEANKAGRLPKADMVRRAALFTPSLLPSLLPVPPMLLFAKGCSQSLRLPLPCGAGLWTID